MIGRTQLSAGLISWLPAVEGSGQSWPTILSAVVTPNFRSSASVSALVVGDDSAWTNILIHYLEHALGYEVTHRANGVEDSEEALRGQPQLMLIVEELPSSGVAAELLRMRTEHAPNCRAVVLSPLTSTSAVRFAFDAGADGYMSTAASLRDFVSALQGVVAGQGQRKVAVAAQVVRHRVENQRSAARPLSLRECEILRLVGEGWASKQIAASLGLSVRTVENHRASIMRKTGLRSAAQLAVRAMELGLVRGTQRLSATLAPPPRALVAAG